MEIQLGCIKTETDYTRPDQTRPVWMELWEQT